ncbi:MAG: hypothetical protein ACRYG8_50865 [Janthinobacterium lividum]
MIGLSSVESLAAVVTPVPVPAVRPGAGDGAGTCGPGIAAWGMQTGIFWRVADAVGTVVATGGTDAARSKCEPKVSVAVAPGCVGVPVGSAMRASAAPAGVEEPATGRSVLDAGEG